MEKRQDPVGFRRIYVPADRPRDWPRGDAKRLPIEPAEFERLVELAQTPVPGGRASKTARLAAGEYRARFLEDRLEAGQGTLRVVHLAKVPVLLPLDPCGLAIGEAHWGPDGQGDPDPVQATLGLGVAGALQLLVERSGQLDFDWSLSGRRDAAGAVRFQLQLPPCPVNRLILDTPEDVIATVDHGIVTEVPSTEQASRRWRIELGGHHRAELRVVATGSGNARRQFPRVRESVTYDFSLRGVDIVTDLEFEVRDESFKQVVLLLDPDLQLVTAKYGGVPVSWSITSADGRPDRAVLLLPEQVQETAGVLQLRAVAPLKLDRSWKLPRIRVEESFWQEGHATLRVRAPLLVTEIEPTECRPSAGMVPLAAPSVGESMQFQFFSPDAKVELALSVHEAPVTVISGTEVVLSGRQMTAQVAADFRTAEAARFSLEADVEPRWLIDSVETRPAEALDDWIAARRDDGRQRLTVHLAKALSPTRPIRLLVTARRLQSPLNRELGAGDLTPLRFSTSEAIKQLIAVDAEGPYLLKLSNTERFRRIAPRSLDMAELDLFSALPRNLLFENDRDAAELRIALESEKPGYEGKLRLEAIVHGETLQEKCELHCSPNSARVDRILVHFSHVRHAGDTSGVAGGDGASADHGAAALRWTLDDDAEQLSARLLSIDEQAALGLAREGETWELTLRRPRTQPFTVHGTRDIRLAGELPVNLALLPEATSQQGTLVVRAIGPKPVRITNNRLESIPAELAPAGRSQTVRAAYRYDPPTDCIAGPDAAVTVMRVDDKTTRSGWVWSGELKSRYEAATDAQHLAIYRLQNSTALALRLRLPPQTTWEHVHGVWVHGKRAAWRKQAGRMVIDLPPGEKFPTVSVQFTTPDSSLGTVGSLRPPLPEVDLPVLSHHWSVWLPPGYEATDRDPLWQSGRSPRLGWSRRMLGPLGRSETGQPFDLLSLEHWSAGASPRVVRRQAELDAKTLLEEFGKLAGTKDDAGPNWGDLLAHPTIRALQPNLLVDTRAMVRMELSPRTLVGAGAGRSASARGASLLNRARLAMLFGSDTVLLTGQAEASLLHAYAEPLRRQTLWWVPPGPLADSLHEAVAAESSKDPSRDLVRVDTWRRRPAEPKTLWRHAGNAGFQPADHSGWTAYRLELPTHTAQKGSPVRLRFVHGHTMRLFGGVVFLAAVALGWWRFGDRPTVLTSAAGVFGVAALVLPEAYVPVATGGCLAMLFCLASGLIRRGNASQLEPSVSTDKAGSSYSRLGIAGRMGLIVLVATAFSVLICAAADGQETPPNVPKPSVKPSSPAVQGVFIPVDEQKKPTGDRYHVPEALYDLLHRHAAAIETKPRGWLITGATYRGVLGKEAGSGRLRVEQFRAVLDLQVFNAATSLQIPFLREGANLLPDRALLDGRPIRVEWDPDRGTLDFQVTQPGPCRLELALQPVLGNGEEAGFDLTIPRLPNARLELSVPPGASRVTVPTALGSIRREVDPTRIVADLGPTDRLTVRWPGGAGPEGAAAEVDVEEMLWLKVQQISVVIDARLKFKVVDGSVRQLRLATDPRLRLDRIQINGLPVEKPSVVSGPSQMITLPWSDTSAKSLVVSATFLLKGSSGIGNLRVPELKTLDARVARRWLAVSVDPALKHASHEPEQLDTVAVPDFLKAWGPTTTQPLFACRLDPRETDFSVRTWPGNAETAADQMIAFSFDPDGADVYFDADLLTTAGYASRYRLTVPAGFKVVEASLMEEGVERVARWAPTKNGSVTVFLNELVAGRQKLSLRGRLPLTGKRTEIPLPKLRIDGATLQSSEISLFRRPSVLLRLDRPGGLTALENLPNQSGNAELGRLMGRFRDEDSAAPRATFSILPNRPRIEAEQVTRLHGDGQSWQAELQWQLLVSDGLVDELRIDAPVSLNVRQAKVLGAATLRVDDETGQLIVRPSTAIRSSYRIGVSAPLDLQPGEHPAVPSVELEQARLTKHLLSLPRQVQGRAVDWDTRNLTEVEPPAAQDEVVAHVEFAVAGSPWQAVLAPADPARDVADIRLADIRLAWKADGTCYGVAAFDLRPGNRSTCPLWLPEPYELIGVRVAGVPTEPIPSGKNRWQLPLGPPRLGQRIEVVFAGPLQQPVTAAEKQFDAPTLGPLSTDKTLWTVVGPRLYRARKLEGEVDAGRQEWIRLQSTAEQIESASLNLTEDVRETAPWYSRWAGRLAAARVALQPAASKAVLTEREKDELDAINRRQSQLATRLGMADAAARLADGPTKADDPLLLWKWSSSSRAAITRCAFSKGVDSLTLSYRPQETGYLLRGLATATALAALTVLLVFALRCDGLVEWFKRWPHVIGVALGLAWWLCLWPSLLGWGIVLASLIGAMLSGWGRRAL